MPERNIYITTEQELLNLFTKEDSIFLLAVQTGVVPIYEYITSKVHTKVDNYYIVCTVNLVVSITLEFDEEVVRLNIDESIRRYVNIDIQEE